MSCVDGVRSVRCLSPREVLRAIAEEAALVVDIRPDFEVGFRVFDVPDLVDIPRRDLAERAPELPHDRLLIVADAVGLHAGDSARVLASLGFERVAYLNGGIVDWDREGYPIRKDPAFELRGQCGCKLRPGGRQRRGEGNPG